MQYKYNTPLMRGAASGYGRLPTHSPHSNSPYMKKKRHQRTGTYALILLTLFGLAALGGGIYHFIASRSSKHLPGETLVHHDDHHYDDHHHHYDDHNHHYDDRHHHNDDHNHHYDDHQEDHRYDAHHDHHYEDHHLEDHHYDEHDNTHEPHEIHHDDDHHDSPHYSDHHDDHEGQHHGDDGFYDQMHEVEFDNDVHHLDSAHLNHHDDNNLGLYDMGFNALDIHGRNLDLHELKGKVTLFVNVASKCGYTQSNYDALKQVYDKYSASGFEILAFPCNDFGSQEPGSNAEIAQFAQEKEARFKMMSKIEKVNSHSIFTWLRAHAPSEGHWSSSGEIEWNFIKFLVSKTGKVAHAYDSRIDQMQLEHDVYDLLTAIE